MKTAKKEDMRKEYRREDLDTGVRGKYYDEYKKGTNLVLLSPDVAKAFPTEEAVNKALRSLINIAQTIGLTNAPAEAQKPRVAELWRWPKIMTVTVGGSDLAISLIRLMINENSII